MSIRCSPSRNVTLPGSSEHSALASPREPQSPLRQWQKANRANVQGDSDKQAIALLAREVQKLRRRILGGGSQQTPGWHKPLRGQYELPAAPYPDYEEGAVIHIQPTHSIVTSGIYDAIQLVSDPTGATTGSLITSCAGYWVAIKSVPSMQTVGGNTFWNLPQYPMPVDTNVDDETNFWIYLGETLPC